MRHFLVTTFGILGVGLALLVNTLPFIIALKLFAATTIFLVKGARACFSQKPATGLASRPDNIAKSSNPKPKTPSEFTKLQASSANQNSLLSVSTAVVKPSLTKTTQQPNPQDCSAEKNSPERRFSK